ncbi:MAG: Glutamine-dependent synthetase, partial [Pseudomonadota bacterium]
MKQLKIAIAQFNATVGDLAGNLTRIQAAAQAAREQGAQILLTPELALCGYPPEDLLLRPDFYQACQAAIDELARSTHGITLVVGYPAEEDGLRFNAAAVIRDGRIRQRYFKQSLPNYEVFDEERYFSAGDEPCVVSIEGVSCGIVICADIWDPQPAKSARQAGAEVLLVLNASPLHLNKTADRLDEVGQRARENDIAVIYANLVGGQDELLFDGASFAVNRRGELMLLMPAFEESLGLVEYRDGEILPGPIAPELSEEAQAWQALVLGVRDYVGKNGFPGVVIGLSGGVDSALTLTLAVDALGPSRVRAVMMPSPYTAQMSLDDSRALVRNLGVQYDEIPIEPAMTTFAQMLAPHFAGRAADTTEENLQARIRGMLLMALSNKTGALVLTTGN